MGGERPLAHAEQAVGAGFGLGRSRVAAGQTLQKGEQIHGYRVQGGGCPATRRDESAQKNYGQNAISGFT
ncbi:hypothetical protein GCM10025871_07600 [Deinococcus metallilatus]|nr:hypothetical protein GCM10025871_07600 [Deinococcus metallilatus]